MNNSLRDVQFDTEKLSIHSQDLLKQDSIYEGIKEPKLKNATFMITEVGKIKIIDDNRIQVKIGYQGQLDLVTYNNRYMLLVVTAFNGNKTEALVPKGAKVHFTIMQDFVGYTFEQRNSIEINNSKINTKSGMFFMVQKHIKKSIKNSKKERKSNHSYAYYQCS